MIIYAHPSSGTPPVFMQKAQNLCMRQSRKHYVYGVGQAAFLGEPPEDAVEIGDGWVCWMNADGSEPETLGKSLGWCRILDAEDQDGEIWSVPMILNSEGRRAFQANYDEDGLPVIPADRQRLLDYALEARAVLLNHYKDRSLKDLPMQAICKWAAAFLECTNHISPRAMGRLGILNDKLVLETIMAVTGAEFGGA
jgi:hypothetical protein